MKIQVENLLTYKELEFDFFAHDLCSVIGSNGSGKSNFLELLGLILYGKLSKTKPKDEIVHFGAKKGIGIATFEDYKGVELKIVRTFTPKESVAVYVDGEDQDFARIADAQEFINERIGDYELYTATVLYPQEGTEFFISAPESSKKGLLEKILQYTKYTEAMIRAKVKRDEIHLDITSTNDDISTVNGALDFAEMELANEEEDSRRYEAEAKASREEAQAELLELEKEDIKPYEKAVEVAKALRDKRRESLPERVDISGLVDTLEEISNKIDLYEDRLDEYTTALKDAESQLGSEAVCPTCGTPWKDDEKQEEHREKVQAKVDSYKKKIKGTKEALKVAKKKRIDVKKEVETETARVEKFEDKYNKARSALDRAEALYDAKVEDLNNVKSHNLSVEARIKQCNDIIASSKVNPHTDSVRRLKASIIKHRKRLVIKQDELDELNDKLAYYDFWVIGFGNSGIKSLMLDEYANTINDRIRNYLEQVTDGDITATFKTQKRLKSGDLREKIDFTINVDGIAQTYSSLSGGQKTVVNMAVMLALRDLAEENYMIIPIMMLDETFSSLDDDYSTEILSLLREISTRAHVYVVSHSEVLRDWTEESVTVSKNNLASVLQ